MNQKTLVDFTDKELHDALRNSAEHVIYSYSDYRDELIQRSQEAIQQSQVRIAKALNILTFVIAAATVINIIVIVLMK